MYNPKTSLFNGRTQSVDYTPTSTAVNAGDVIVINSVVYFAIADIAVNVLGSLVFSGGVWAGNKANVAWNVGDRIYWNPTGNPVNGTAGTGCFQNTPPTGGYFCGYAIASPNTSAGAQAGDSLGYFAKATGTGSDLRSVAGQWTSVTAADTVATGLNVVVAVVASLDSDPGDNPEWCSATIGNQSGAPVAGSVIIKTWQNTSGTDPTPVAATTFGKKVNYIAVGY